MTTQQNLVGTEIAGRFRLVELLGEGGAGQVYRAEHAVLERPFAIKVLLDSVRHDKRFAERFRVEARTASLLQHPNIVNITDFGRTEQGRLYLVMQYVDGESLEQINDRLRPDTMPLGRSIPILAQVCGAVQAAHAESIVHRDLKPDNVMIGRTPSGDELAKVLDFGLAKILSGAGGDGDGAMRITGKGEIFGTPEYMSPEQARGEPVDQRADVYSLGAMAYELFTGRPPIAHPDLGDQLRAVLQEEPVPLRQARSATEPPLPEAIEAAVHQCLIKDREQRAPSVDSLLTVLQAQRVRLPSKRSLTVPGVELHKILGSSGGGRTEGLVDTWEDDQGDLMALTDTLRVRMSTSSAASTAPDGEASTARELIWAYAMKKATHLARQLVEQRVAAEAVVGAMQAVHEAEERVLNVETELAVERANLDETNPAADEAESRLRFAIMDLNVERDQLLEAGRADPQGIEDLDYQIRVLELSLAELYRERAGAESAQEETVREIERYADLCHGKLTEAETALVHRLFEARPAPCPRGLQVIFGQLEAALRSFDAAQ